MSYNLNGPEFEEILQLDFRRKKKERKKWIVSANERPPSPVHLPQVTALWAPAPPVCSLRPLPPIAIGQAAAAHSIGGRAEARAASLRGSASAAALGRPRRGSRDVSFPQRPLPLLLPRRGDSREDVVCQGNSHIQKPGC